MFLVYFPLHNGILKYEYLLSYIYSYYFVLLEFCFFTIRDFIKYRTNAQNMLCFVEEIDLCCNVKGSVKRVNSICDSCLVLFAKMLLIFRGLEVNLWKLILPNNNTQRYFVNIFIEQTLSFLPLSLFFLNIYSVNVYYAHTRNLHNYSLKI